MKLQRNEFIATCCRIITLPFSYFGHPSWLRRAGRWWSKRFMKQFFFHSIFRTYLLEIPPESVRSIDLSYYFYII
jgi:hypothetical protein